MIEIFCFVFVNSTFLLSNNVFKNWNPIPNDSTHWISDETKQTNVKFYKDFLFLPYLATHKNVRVFKN